MLEDQDLKCHGPTPRPHNFGLETKTQSRGLQDWLLPFVSVATNA